MNDNFEDKVKDFPRMMSIEEVAYILNIKPDTLRKRIRTDPASVPEAINIGKTGKLALYRFHPDAVDRFLKAIKSA